MSRDDRRPIPARPVGPERPLQLGGGEAGGVDLDEGIADGRHRIGCILVDDPVDPFEADRLVDPGGLHRALSIVLLLCHIGDVPAVTAMTRRCEGM